ncbi:hypothetical protein [Microcella humidisoli]|uniref:Uncharacterized protein n=1 Tax=Microcella humidisoli TaxID=2963406 RepID=A0ABY5FZQ1_9MICO|nr:hypothetical protein [Microcella humidisoli]UTT63604.1 hypothetical protein NNL39_05755 [Microcella humidisoli]
MLLVSLLLNIVVLVPVVGSLAARAPWIVRAWGERAPARDILLAIYIAILTASTALLAVVAMMGPSTALEAAAVSLLAVQIVYKVLTAVTVQDALRNPVVLSNLGIAVVHAVTVATIAPGLYG